MAKALRIFVVCSYSLSSSQLAGKIQQYADDNDLPAIANSISPDRIKSCMDKCDVVLLSPQVRFSRSVFEALLAPVNIPVIDVPMQVYGLMDAEKAYALAVEAHNKSYLAHKE